MNNTTNNCSNVADVYPDLVDNTALRSIFGLLYSAIWLLGVAGNSLVLYAAVSKKVSFTVRHIFITSLAGSDLIIGVMSLPITAVLAFTREWPFGEHLCRTVGFFQASSIFISSFTLTAIAVDRFYLIINPSISYITYTRARIIVFVVWCLGYCFASPMIVFQELESFNDTCGMFCQEKWPSPMSRRFYGVNVLLLQFGLPVLISTYCYAAISGRLARQIAYRHQSTLPSAERRLIQRRRRTNLMMTMMVVFFVLAWLPLNSINLIRDFGSTLDDSDYFNFIFVLCHLASMTSLVWNPIIYSFFNDSFRTAVKVWLKKPIKKRKSTASSYANNT